MAIFRLTARNGSVELIVRARCISCARQIAAERSPAAERVVWRDSEQSVVDLIRNPEHHGYLSEGKIGLIHRTVRK